MAIISYNIAQPVPSTEPTTAIITTDSDASISSLILSQPALVLDSADKFTRQGRGKCQAVVAAPPIIDINISTQQNQ
ncbi:hypothetical protein RSOLAG1IB_07291 [Rhizoctonia solani AG-1 IB]|uniref:Uncharacterized protein n=1 Tax=Thanatephorus cucumeris (strain AG1-IB / isolate 7/3/14) TaxID=1108050 RepID=A0A0B7FEW5_THACB|nr:hypothetical protein RSOLAG1IB_07291 [Rhizoctonia solani AG-1 IB]